MLDHGERELAVTTGPDDSGTTVGDQPQRTGRCGSLKPQVRAAPTQVGLYYAQPQPNLGCKDSHL